MLCCFAGRKGGTSDFIHNLVCSNGAMSCYRVRLATVSPPRYLLSDDYAQGRGKSPVLGSERPRDTASLLVTLFFLFESLPY